MAAFFRTLSHDSYSSEYWVKGSSARRNDVPAWKFCIEQKINPNVTINHTPKHGGKCRNLHAGVPEYRPPKVISNHFLCS